MRTAWTLRRAAQMDIRRASRATKRALNVCDGYEERQGENATLHLRYLEIRDRGGCHGLRDEGDPLTQAGSRSIRSHGGFLHLRNAQPVGAEAASASLATELRLSTPFFRAALGAYCQSIVGLRHSRHGQQEASRRT